MLDQTIKIINVTTYRISTGYDADILKIFVKNVEKRAELFCGFDVFCH